MDTTSLLFINSLLNNGHNRLYEMFILMFLFFIINYYKETAINFVESNIKFLFKKNSFLIEGFSMLTYYGERPKIPKEMKALMYYLIKNKYIQNLIYSNYDNEYDDWDDDDVNITNNVMFHCLSDKINNIRIENDIYITNKITSVDSKEKEIAGTGNNILETKKYSMLLQSNKNNLIEFLNKCTKEYNDYIKKQKSNKIWHFVFRERETGKKNEGGGLIFSTNMISDLLYKKNNETFDHIIHEHKEKIINDIDQLKNLDYYKKTGLKRKKGYLFFGPPGCGKTSTVMAISNYDNRHIIEVPFSRLKTNKDIEDILNINEIDGVKFKKSEIILLFDEIDHGYEYLHENKKESSYTIINNETKEIKEEKKEETKKDDKINLGCLLSRLDGIGNYDGLIIIATTNNINKIDKALYRCGRLTLVEYEYCKKSNIIKFIEKFFDIKLSKTQIDKIPDNPKMLVPATLITLIENYKNNIDDLLDFLNKEY
jgi:hypothetical protein